MPRHTPLSTTLLRALSRSRRHLLLASLASAILLALPGATAWAQRDGAPPPEAEEISTGEETREAPEGRGPGFFGGRGDRGGPSGGEDFRSRMMDRGGFPGTARGDRSTTPTAAPLRDAEGHILVPVNLRDANIDQIVKFISDNTGKSVILQSNLQAKINVMTPNPVRLEEALDLIYQALLLDNILVVETDNRLIFVQADKASSIPVPVDTGDDETSKAYVTRVVPLQHAQAAALTGTLQPVLGPGGSVTALGQSNSLMIKATRAAAAMAESLIENLDVPDAAGMEVRIFNLRNSDATTLAGLINEVLKVAPSTQPAASASSGASTPTAGGESDRPRPSFFENLPPEVRERFEQERAERDARRGGRGDRGSDSPPSPPSPPSRGGASASSSASPTGGTTIIPDPSNNRLIVAASGEKMERVADLIAKLDGDATGDIGIRKLTLSYGRASDLQKALSQVFSKLPRRSDRDLVEISATVDERQLLILSSRENYALIESLLEDLDRQDQLELEFIALRYADCVDVMTLLSELLQASYKVAGQRMTSQASPSTGSAWGSGSSRSSSRSSRDFAVFSAEGEGRFTAKGPIQIIAETRTNSLLVSANEDDLKIVRELVEKIDRPREAPVTVHIKRLDFADAQQVADAASQFFPPASQSPRDEIVIVASTYDNTVMALASEENWKRIEAFILDMDRSDYGRQGRKTYDLKYVDAQKLAEQLTQLFQESQTASPFSWFSGTRATGDRYNFVASPAGNQLMVVVPPKEISVIDELVEQLDSPEALKGLRPKIYYITHTDASEMKDVLTQLFESSDTAAAPSGAQYYWSVYSRPQTTTTGASLVGKVNFVVDRDANALIAIASNPMALEIVDELIHELDAMAPEHSNTEMIQLEYSDALNMAILLNTLFGGAMPRQQGQQGQQQAGGQADASNISGVSTQNRSALKQSRYSELYFWWQATQQQQQQTQESRPISTLIEKVRIVPDIRTNMLIVTAASHHLETLRALIARLDRSEPQVLIQTHLVEIAHTKEKRVGVRWTPDPSTIAPEELDNAISALTSLSILQPFGRPDASITATRAAGGFPQSITRTLPDAGRNVLSADTNIGLLLQLLLKNTNSRMVSYPMIMVNNNEQGSIFVGDEVPFITNSQISDVGTRNDSFEYREVGTRLDITPHINRNGQVVLEIDLVAANRRPGETLFGAEILSRRQYSTEIAVEDGQTLVLGGILGEKEDEIRRRTPLLGDIPGLGKAFRKTDRSRVTTELVAFVTPTLILDRFDADVATRDVIDRARLDPPYAPDVAIPTAEQIDILRRDAGRRGQEERLQEEQRRRALDEAVRQSEERLRSPAARRGEKPASLSRR